MEHIIGFSFFAFYSLNTGSRVTTLSMLTRAEKGTREKDMVKLCTNHFEKDMTLIIKIIYFFKSSTLSGIENSPDEYDPLTCTQAG